MTIKVLLHHEITCFRFSFKKNKKKNNLRVVTVVEPGPGVVGSGDGSGDVIKAHYSGVLDFTSHLFHSEVGISHIFLKLLLCFVTS